MSPLDPPFQPGQLESSQRALVRDGAWSSLAGSLTSGVVIIGFALALGAGPLEIGMLAAIPSLGQLAQLPAIALVERLRRRRRITVVLATASRLLILAMALLPFVEPPAWRLPLLLGGQLAITLLGAMAGCSFNSWVHQLLPVQTLGAFFARKLLWSTVVGSVGALAAGALVQYGPFAERLQAFALVFAAAGIAGFVSSWYLTRVAEPPMLDALSNRSFTGLLAEPFGHPEFRRLLVFLAAWNFASSLAAPFLTVYLLQQLGYGLATVTMLWAASQAANALTLWLWGRLSDRLSNKSVLSVALPVYFASLFGIAFVATPGLGAGSLWVLYLIHVTMGVAGGGASLAIGNLGLKLAPRAQGTAFLAVAGLSGALAAALASLGGGAMAEWFAARELSVSAQWVAPQSQDSITFIRFRHWEFLFAIAAGFGLYAMHALSRLREGEEISERTVVRQFLIEAGHGLESLSSVAGSRLEPLLPFGRWWRDRGAGRPDAGTE